MSNRSFWGGLFIIATLAIASGAIARGTIQRDDLSFASADAPTPGLGGAGGNRGMGGMFGSERGGKR